MLVIEPVASENGMPAALAARASSSSPWYHIMPAAPVGAMPIGILCSLPYKVVSSLRPETSTSMRGLSLMRSNASRLLRSATSSSVPRSTNSNSHFGRRRLAMSRRSNMFCASSSLITPPSSLREYGFRNHPVYALGAVHHLRDVVIHRHAGDHVSLLARQVGEAARDERDGLARDDLHRFVEIGVQSHHHPVRRRFAARPDELHVLAHDELEAAAQAGLDRGDV